MLPLFNFQGELRDSLLKIVDIRLLRSQVYKMQYSNSTLDIYWIAENVIGLSHHSSIFQLILHIGSSIKRNLELCDSFVLLDYVFISYQALSFCNLQVIAPRYISHITTAS